MNILIYAVEDKLTWKLSMSGVFAIKSAYNTIHQSEIAFDLHDMVSRPSGFSLQSLFAWKVLTRIVLGDLKGQHSSCTYMQLLSLE